MSHGGLRLWCDSAGCRHGGRRRRWVWLSVGMVPWKHFTVIKGIRLCVHNYTCSRFNINRSKPLIKSNGNKINGPPVRDLTAPTP
ncbi:hypothetical protein QL285_068312 [Trifolium repens]|nr:hypothetical protein QL285_068312 [Trifolium repens]